MRAQVAPRCRDLGIVPYSAACGGLAGHTRRRDVISMRVGVNSFPTGRPPTERFAVQSPWAYRNPLQAVALRLFRVEVDAGFADGLRDQAPADQVVEDKAAGAEAQE